MKNKTTCVDSQQNRHTVTIAMIHFFPLLLCSSILQIPVPFCLLAVYASQQPLTFQVYTAVVFFPFFDKSCYLNKPAVYVISYISTLFNLKLQIAQETCCNFHDGSIKK